MARPDQQPPISVFLVEDHHIMRRGLASLLMTEWNVRILGECGSGEEALEMLRESEIPDLVIMDVSLPGLNGIETTRQIKNIMASTRVLILSMYDNPTFVHQALEAGASGYILKKAMVEELNRATNALLGGGKYISPEIVRSAEGDTDLQDGIFQSFTPQEREIFKRLASGMSVKDIATDLILSPYTVYTHVNNIRRKIGVKKTADMIRYAIENPLILNGLRPK